MPWYIVAYVAVLAVIAAYSFFDDVKSVPAWYVVTDAVVSLFWILAVFAYYEPRLAPPASAGLALLIAALLWTAWDVRRELQGAAERRAESYDPELSPGTNLWVDRGVEAAGVVVGGMVLAPAVIFAVRVLLRAPGVE